MPSSRVFAKWQGDRCILCLATGNLSDEHIIPRALGGILTVDLLCTACNNNLGSKLDSLLARDPELRSAAARIANVSPTVADYALNGMTLKGTTDIGAIELTFKNGKSRVTPITLDDSVVIDTKEGAGAITRKLQRASANEEEILAALEKFKQLPDGQLVDLGHGVRIIKRSVRDAKPMFEGQPAGDLCFLKVAYEWLACNVGVAIYADQLTPFRRAILDDQPVSDRFAVERLDADVQDPVHGLVAEKNDPHAIIHIALFGMRRYRVHFRGIAINGPRHVYTLDLRTGSDAIGYAS